MLGKIISPEQSKKMSDFATGEANKKRCLHSSQQLPRCSAKIISPEQSTKMSDFAMGVANEK
jgi:hypothetical protein